MLRQACTALNSAVAEKVERQALSWMNLHCALFQTPVANVDYITSCICFGARKGVLAYVYDEHSLFTGVLSDLSVGMEELEPDAPYDEDNVRALLLSGDGSVNGSVSTDFGWSIEYHSTARRARKMRRACLRTSSLFLRCPHVYEDIFLGGAGEWATICRLSNANVAASGRHLVLPDAFDVENAVWL